MPINESLNDLKLPVRIKKNEPPRTVFKNQLDTIKVQLMYAPSLQDLLSYIPDFATATWQDTPNVNIKNEERNKVLQDLFDNKLLPTAYETINLTFRIEGMDIIDTTHLIRHRALSFSAQCSADRDLRKDDAVVKPGIMVNSKFYERYIEITKQSKQLYADMVDSEEISLLDARTILPRNLETFYYVRGNLKDLMDFIRQRLDEQIQPTSDNIIAMRMWLEIIKQYPPLIGKINIGGPDQWYISTVQTGRSSNIYMPKKENDVFEYKKQWFLYPKRRSDFKGMEVYDRIKKEIIQEIEELKLNKQLKGTKHE